MARQKSTREPARDKEGNDLQAVWDKDGEELLSTASAGAYLDLAASTIRVLAATDKLHPIYQNGRSMTFKRSELDAYKAESLGRPGRKPSKPEERG